MNRPALYRRIRRRELHAPRSIPAIVVALLVAVALAYVGTELVLRVAGQPPLLAAPADLYAWVRGLPDLVPASLAALGIGLMIVGLIPLLLAVLPGRRGRHTLPSERAVVLVDDEVIASSLARTAAATGRVSADNARVSVGRRRADVRLTPTSGVPIDSASVQRRIDEQLAAYRTAPAITGRVQVATSGAVGA